MSYGLSHLKLDLSGPDGNVYVVVAKCAKLVKKIEGPDEAKNFSVLAIGEPARELGQDWTYEDVLVYCKKKTGITFVSDRKLDIDPELYEIEERSCYL